MTNTFTPGQLEVRTQQEEREAKIALHVERIITELQALNVPIEDIEKHRDGVRIKVPALPWHPTTVYIYAFPWSRGWSIYASPQHDAYCHNWSNAGHKFRDFQHPLYVDRDLTGAHNIAPSRIAVKMALTRHDLWDRIEGAKVRNANKMVRAQHWYWPRSVMAHLARKEPYVATW